MHQAQLFSGARGKIYVKDGNGAEKLVAIATSIDVSVAETLIPSYVIGEINPLSIEPTGVDANVSIGRLIPMNAMNDQSADPAQVTAIQAGLEKQINDILTAPSVEIRIEDKITGKTVSAIKEARFAGRTYSQNAQGLSSERLNFVGIYDAADGNTPDDMGYGQ